MCWILLSSPIFTLFLSEIFLSFSHLHVAVSKVIFQWCDSSARAPCRVQLKCQKSSVLFPIIALTFLHDIPVGQSLSLSLSPLFAHSLTHLLVILSVELHVGFCVTCRQMPMNALFTTFSLLFKLYLVLFCITPLRFVGLFLDQECSLGLLHGLVKRFLA